MISKWVAEYSDGTQVDKKDVSYFFLDRSKLKWLGLVDDDGNVVVKVNAEAGKVPFYRIYTHLNVESGEVGMRFWVIGVRSRVGDSFTILYPDGTKEHCSGWSGRPFLYEPDWFPSEVIQ